MSTYTVTIPVVITVEADNETAALNRASFMIGHGVHYVYGGEWVTRLEDQATVTS
jgi:hypothetical protein